MRALLIVTLMLLPACSTMREVAGKQRDVAENGIPGVKSAGAAEAAAPAEAKQAKATKAAPLPTGLGGDHTHGVPPQS